MHFRTRMDGDFARPVLAPARCDFDRVFACLQFQICRRISNELLVDVNSAAGVGVDEVGALVAAGTGAGTGIMRLCGFFWASFRIASHASFTELPSDTVE